VTLPDPRFATNTNYSSGTDTGLPTKVTPSTGRRANGFERDVPLAAPVLNAILHAHSEHILAMTDAPSLSWEPQDAYVNADVIAGATPNRNEANDQAIFYSAHERLILKTPGGGTGVCFHSRVRGQGLLYAGAGDTVPFTACADSGATAGAVILTAREQSTRIVAINGSSGTCRQSIDYGATWSAAGTYGGLAGPECGGYFDGAWHAANAGTPKEIFSSSSLSGAWTQTTLTADANTYYRFIAANNGLVDVVGIFLPGTCTTTTQLLVKPQGAAWQVVTVTGAGASSGWRGDYNATTGVILIADVTGRCFASTNGLTWTLVFNEAQGVYDVAAHGQGFVLSCVTEDFSGPATIPHLRFLAPGLAGVWASTRIPWEGYALTYSRYHLVRHRGRVYAGRVFISGSDRLEWWESEINPASVAVLA
jgi:hypothetical protein